MMTHIYKVYRTAASALLLTAALTACTDTREPAQQNDPPGEGTFLSVTATQGGGAETRVTHTPNTTTQGVDVKWAAGDEIYVGKTDGIDGSIKRQLSTLTISPAGAGQTTARFEGEIAADHQPANGGILYAVYGEKSNIQFRNGAFDYSYSRQRQTANGDMAHLASYDYMSASTTYDPHADTHHFDFSHAGSLMKFSLGGLGGKAVKKLMLTTIDMTQVFPEGNYPKSEISLDLGAVDGTGIRIENGGKLEAYLMIGASTKPAGKRLILYVTDTDGKQYATMLTGAEIAAGKVYTIAATLTPYSFEGAGTAGDPYLITSAGDLTRLSLLTNLGMIDTQGMHFKLTNDINLTEEKDWLPIGYHGYKPFKGTFTGEKATGGNCSVNINIAWNEMKYLVYAGLFGCLEGATIKDVTVTGEINVTTSDRTAGVGGIAGTAKNSTIEGCISQCSITLGEAEENGVAGGILGYNASNVNVINCRNTGCIAGRWSGGGIIGESTTGNCTISDCVNQGSIIWGENSMYAGGIIGLLQLGPTGEKFTVANCSHTGSTPAPRSAGCIIGSYTIKQGTAPFSTITITNSEGAATITGDKYKEVAGRWPQNDIN